MEDTPHHWAHFSLKGQRGTQKYPQDTYLPHQMECNPIYISEHIADSSPSRPAVSSFLLICLHLNLNCNSIHPHLRVNLTELNETCFWAGTHRITLFCLPTPTPHSLSLIVGQREANENDPSRFSVHLWDVLKDVFSFLLYKALVLQANHFQTMKNKCVTAVLMTSDTHTPSFKCHVFRIAVALKSYFWSYRSFANHIYIYECQYWQASKSNMGV